jgi:hypothetical protein
VASDAAAEAFAQAIGRETHLPRPSTLGLAGGLPYRRWRVKGSHERRPRSSVGRAKGCLVIEPFTVAEKRLQVRYGV